MSSSRNASRPAGSVIAFDRPAVESKVIPSDRLRAFARRKSSSDQFFEFAHQFDGVVARLGNFFQSLLEG